MSEQDARRRHRLRLGDERPLAALSSTAKTDDSTWRP